MVLLPSCIIYFLTDFLIIYCNNELPHLGLAKKKKYLLFFFYILSYIYIYIYLFIFTILSNNSSFFKIISEYIVFSKPK